MFVDVFSHKIYYELYGAEHKDILLYLHGGPGASCLDFVNQAQALSKKIKVISFDQLGVLRSDAIGADEDYSMEYQVEMLEEMRNETALDTALKTTKEFALRLIIRGKDTPEEIAEITKLPLEEINHLKETQQI